MSIWISLYKSTRTKPTIVKISRGRIERIYQPSGSSLKRIVKFLNEGNTLTYKNAWALEWRK